MSHAIGELTINGRKLSGADLANGFDDHFVCVAESATPFPTSNTVCDSNLFNIAHSAFFVPTTNEEVISTFINLNNSTSLDIDDLQIKPIKFVINIIAPALTHIFNLALETSISRANAKS